MPLDFIAEKREHFVKNFRQIKNIYSNQVGVINYLVECKATKHRYVCKSMSFLDESSLREIEHERDILSRLDNANIPKLLEVASSSDHIYMIKQMVSGVTLHEWIYKSYTLETKK